MEKETVVIVIGCMDRRENEPIERLRESLSLEGVRLIDLRAAAAHVDALKDDIIELVDRYNVREIHLWPHTNGCGGAKVVKGIGCGDAGTNVLSGDVRGRFADQILDAGVDPHAAPPEIEVSIGDYEHGRLVKLLKSMGRDIPIRYDILEFGDASTHHQGHHAVMFRLPSDASLRDATSKAGLEMDGTYVLSSRSIENVMIYFEIAAKVMGIKDLVLVAYGNEQERKVREAGASLRYQPFVAGDVKVRLVKLEERGRMKA